VQYVVACVAVCCSVVYCVAVCCFGHELSPGLRVCATRCTLQSTAIHYFSKIPMRCSALRCGAECCSVLQSVSACCSVFQRVALCCSVLQCVAVCCNVPHWSLIVPLQKHTHTRAHAHTHKRTHTHTGALATQQK